MSLLKKIFGKKERGMWDEIPHEEITSVHTFSPATTKYHVGDILKDAAGNEYITIDTAGNFLPAPCNVKQSGPSAPYKISGPPIPGGHTLFNQMGGKYVQPIEDSIAEAGAKLEGIYYPLSAQVKGMPVRIGSPVSGNTVELKITISEEKARNFHRVLTFGIAEVARREAALEAAAQIVMSQPVPSTKTLTGRLKEEGLDVI